MDTGAISLVTSIIKIKASGIATHSRSPSFQAISLEELGKRLKASGDLRSMVEYVASRDEYSMDSVFLSAPTAIKILREMRAEKSA